MAPRRQRRVDDRRDFPPIGASRAERESLTEEAALSVFQSAALAPVEERTATARAARGAKSMAGRRGRDASGWEGGGRARVGTQERSSRGRAFAVEAV